MPRIQTQRFLFTALLFLPALALTAQTQKVRKKCRLPTPFIAGPDSVCRGIPVFFSAPEVGGTSALPNPSHTFSDTGVHTVCVTVVNDCGSNVYCLEVTAPTGIESTMITAAVKVYPNPANSSITVAGAGSGTTLRLYEVTGKLALEQTLRNSRAVNLNISHLPDGIYLLKFTDGKGRRGMTKVVKR